MIEWKPIKNYEDYLISNYGQVKRNNTILKEWEHNKYHYITLCKNGKKKNFLLHRLVAETFLPNPNNLPQINHKDENPANNNVENLEWCSSKYNANYGTRNERYSKKVVCIETGEMFNSITKATKEKKIKYNGINFCLSGRQKTAGGFHWMKVGC